MARRAVASLGGGSSTGTPYLASITSRNPRVLVLADSMGQNLREAQVTPFNQNITVDVSNWDGDTTASGAAAMAVSTRYLARKGNIFPDSRLNYWDATRCTVTHAEHPTAGRYMYHVQDTGTQYSYLNKQFTVSSDMAAGCIMSFLFQQTGANNAFQFLGTVGATQKISFVLQPYATVGTGVQRWGISLPAGWAAENDVVDFYVVADYGVTQTTPADYWIGEFQFNAGDMMAPYEHTIGIAGTPGELELVRSVDGADRDNYDLAAIVFYNDWHYGSVRSREALSSLVDSCLRHVRRVLIMTPPPKVVAGEFIYDDEVVAWRQIMREVAESKNCFFSDTPARAKALVDAGTYTPTQLMVSGTNIHPNQTGASNFFGWAIANAVESSTDKLPMRQNDGGDYQVGSLVHTGTWTNTITAQSTFAPYVRQTGIDYNGLWYQQSTNAGDTITYVVTGRQIALSFPLTGAAGSVNVAVDGRFACETPLGTGGGATAYANTSRLVDGNGIALDFGAGSHTVVVTVASGTAKLIGCVGY
jgi:hypothetical protein